MADQGADQESSHAGIPPAAAAAAAAASSSHHDNNDDVTMAQALQMVETLTSLFGFSYDAANEAVNVVGATDVQACCDYILDQGLGVDGGGAIAPKDDCPHLEHGMQVFKVPLDVFTRPCCYYSKKTSGDKKMPAATATSGDLGDDAKPAARLKDDIDEATGVCSMGENWMCLRCGDVYCSRYINGHGLCHWEETAAAAAAAAAASSTNDERNNSGHCVMVSLTDLSVWCNVCGAYLVHDSLKPIVKQLQQIKFPEEAKGAEQVCKKAKSTERATEELNRQSSITRVIYNAKQIAKPSYKTSMILPSSSPTSKSVRQCPCKLLPQSFSSFTAAEYGDLHTLAKIGPAIARRRDEVGYTPLHLAAQNNHVAATALLLQLGCHVDGLIIQERGMDDIGTTSSCGATPLHRSAFSGATAAMKILLEWNMESAAEDSAILSKQRCNLLAKDTSFGDESTPLHKAAAGGRYLAVFMLLDALRTRQVSNSQNEISFLQRALTAKDKLGQTPLDIARHYLTIQDTERRAVARWDEVAGGPPDWSKCVQLLQDAEKELVNASAEKRREIQERKAEMQNLPPHLTGGVNACMDCDDKGQCLTTSWEAAFQRALVGSANNVLKGSVGAKPSEDGMKREPSLSSDRSQFAADSDVEKYIGSTLENTEETNQHSMGTSCTRCHKMTIAMYLHPTTKQLVCKKCLR